MPFNKVHLIVNPAAGQPQPILHAMNKVFFEHDVDWDISVTTKRRSALELTQQAVKNGADLVVACGGDGTVSEVINGLMGTDIPLGLLHGGTGNALAYRLGIPKDLEQAAQVIVAGHRLQGVDLGKSVCDGEEKYFILRASAGLQHEILETASRELKDRFGNLAYVMASLQSLTDIDSKILTYRLNIDGEAIEADGVTCMVVNCATVGGPNSFEFAPDVDPCDGLLDVFVFNANFQSFVDMINNVINKNAAPFPQRWQGKEITIQLDSQQTVTLDGEEFGKSPFTVSIAPQAIQIVVPEEQNA